MEDLERLAEGIRELMQEAKTCGSGEYSKGFINALEDIEELIEDIEPVLVQPEVTRECTRCLERKPLSMFQPHPRYRLGRRTWCEKCYKDYQSRAAHNRHLKSLYDLTQKQWDKILESQDGACRVCGDVVSLVVDHDHTTGKVRSLLCGSCNRTLGHAKEDPARLRALADYLEEVL